ncbi:Stf0 family sulfotransferase [Rhodocytophaga aerolata]|uniref:Stf0 family sulfotransferase n=1 Tax=Rhodocytophaga aerolata TaxID=455078 RepID=A0ABT8R2C4_9BACT|nr:Stf0 family sulfotransferase [Rhodocytophaga aerolata]MDO1445448.1 Stf0 family sulfotransferase [Rhodocytophaga aerolata]
MKPRICYTVWFSQRNRSTLLCEGLTATGIAGKPAELLELPPATSLLDFYQVNDYAALQAKLWQQRMTENGVFGMKANAPRKESDPIIGQLAKLSGLKVAAPTPYAVWENAFPNGKHIFLTRRNKIRQAVSWWKAIVTGQWHLEKGGERKVDSQVISQHYNFEAIKHLLLEISLRESKIQAFLEEGNIVPLTVVYEDFVKQYQQSIRSVIDFLGITDTQYPIKEPHYERLADELSDQWVERFRIQLQKDWKNVIW